MILSFKCSNYADHLELQSYSSIVVGNHMAARDFFLLIICSYFCSLDNLSLRKGRINWLVLIYGFLCVRKFLVFLESCTLCAVWTHVPERHKRTSSLTASHLSNCVALSLTVWMWNAHNDRSFFNQDHIHNLKIKVQNPKEPHWIAISKSRHVNGIKIIFCGWWSPSLFYLFTLRH